MEKSFCKNCEEEIPACAIVKMPSKASIDDLVNGTNIRYQEYLVCHKNAQIFDEGLKINDLCDECRLCQITCTKIKDKKEYIDYAKLEKLILKNFDKLAILIKTLYPNLIVSQEVQVKGNYRAKRIDICIINQKTVYLIKVLANIDKIPLYSRSYEEVKTYYEHLIKHRIVHYCLIAKNKMESSICYEYPCICLEDLIEQLED